MNMINIENENESSECPLCVDVKYARKPFKSVTNRSTELLELIHSDLADFKNKVVEEVNNIM